MTAPKKTLESETFEKLAAEYLDYMENVSADQWVAPYTLLADSDRPRNAKTQTPFNGITNTLFLTLMKLKRGYPSNEWATYRQWQDIGAQVRKGEKGIPIIKVVQRLKKDAMDEDYSVNVRNILLCIRRSISVLLLITLTSGWLSSPLRLLAYTFA